MATSITVTRIRNLIYNIRGKAVMLDSDLAELYQVKTKILNQTVRRNIDRFPDDFMFQLTENEFKSLRSQFVTSKRGGRRYMPYVFTEQGVAMLSSVLKSDIAIKTNIQIMRAFVQISRLGLTVVDLKRKLDSMEKKYDNQFRVVFKAIQQLIAPPPVKKSNKKMGFAPPKKK
jgi:hypothetical protein